MRLSVFFFIIWIMFWVMSPPMAGAEDRALLIGVGKYQKANANLPGIEKDISSMKKVASLLGFKKVKVLMDGQAGAENIKKSMQQWLVNGATRNDRVLFYFSGHGSFVPDKNKDETQDHVDEVLLAHDAKVSGGGLTGVLLDDDFSRLLSQIKARVVMVFIDACHSGTATKGLLFKGMTLEETTGQPDLFHKFFYYPGMPLKMTTGVFAVEKKAGAELNFISLSAARDDEKAIATKQGSLFTRAILDSVKRAGAAGRKLTMNGLLAESEKFIGSTVSSPSKMHHPQLYGNVKKYADMNLFKTPGGDKRTSMPVEQKDSWSELENITSGAKYKVEVSSNQDRYKVGDRLTITCKSPMAGYINVLTVSEGEKDVTVLFPNKHHPDNRVAAGAEINIPALSDSFLLRANPPRGKNMVVVLHTTREINAYRDGYDGNNNLFKIFSDKSLFSYKGMRGFKVEAKQSNQLPYGAGSITTVIE